MHTSKNKFFLHFSLPRGENGVPMFCHICLFGVGLNQRGEAAMDGGAGNRECGHSLRGPAYNGLG